MNVGIKGKILLTVLALGILVCTVVVWQVVEFANSQTTRTSLAAAESLAGQVRELRGYYTDRLVSRIRG